MLAALRGGAAELDGILGLVLSVQILHALFVAGEVGATRSSAWSTGRRARRDWVGGVADGTGPSDPLRRVGRVGVRCVRRGTVRRAGVGAHPCRCALRLALARHIGVKRGVDSC